MQFKNYRSRHQGAQQSTDSALHWPFYGGVLRSKRTVFVRHRYVRHDITRPREYTTIMYPTNVGCTKIMICFLFCYSTQACAIGRENELISNVLAQNYLSANRGILGAIDLALRSLCVIVEPDTNFIEVTVTAFNRPFEVSTYMVFYRLKQFRNALKNDNSRTRA